MSGRIGRIGWKSIEIMTTKSQWISTQIDQHLSQWIYTQIDQHLSQWIYPKFDRAYITGQIGWKLTEITFYACLVKLGIISVDLHPIWLGGQILYPWSNLTGHKLLVKLGGNSLRLHCMPAWSNWVSSQWIYTQFEGGSNSIPQSNSTGQIGGKSIEIMTTKFDQAYNVISIGYHLSGFPPNLRGGQILSPQLNLG